MGLFDKIKDNAKTISMKAIESTREYDEDYLAEQATTQTEQPTSVPKEEPKADEPADKPAGQPEAEAPAEVSEETPIEEPKDQTKSEEPKEPARKSRITEIPKAKYEQAQKPYTPHYKAGKKTDEKSDEKAKVEVKQEKAKESNKVAVSDDKLKKAHIIDIAPKKPEDNVKKAIYARERATMAALSTQRRLNGTTPLYVTNHMNFKTRVFINRIEYSGSFGRTVVPMDHVAWVKLRHGGTGVIIETTESKRVVLVVKPADRLSFANAVMKVQGMQPKKGQKIDNATVRIDQLEKFGEGIDEIEKLAKLFDKGIITQDEFDAKKKLILGI